MQLYINNQLADLSDDSPIALSFQINNLAEVKNQQGNTSNQFKLPLTQNNRRILGFPDEVAFTTDLPYRQYPAKIIQDGLEIIPNGTAELNGVDNDTANITVLSGNVDFFDGIDGKLYDMGDKLTAAGANLPFAAYQHEWNLQNVVASQRNTEGWIWPLVDYVTISYKPDQPLSVDVSQLRPGFFLKTAIDLIVKSAGFKAKGSLLNDPLYNQLIVQFANDSFEHGVEYQNTVDSLSASARKTMNQELSKWWNGDQYIGTISFTEKLTDTSNSYNAGSSSYVAGEALTVNAKLTYNIHVTDIREGGENPSVVIQILKHNPYTGVTSTVTETTHMAGSDAKKKFLGDNKDGEPAHYLNQTLSQDTTLQAGESLYIAYKLLPSQVHVKAMFDAGAEFIITNTKSDVTYRQQVQCERIFPDISMKDLLKDTLQRFGIICQTDSTNRTVTFASFRDIVNNIPNAKDWTAKCLDQGKSITFQLGGYARANYMRYKEDDGIVPKTYGHSQINVDDKTLPPTADLFESQFAPTLNTPYATGTIAQILKVEADDEEKAFSIGTEPRILIDHKVQLGDKKVTFTDGSSQQVVNDVISTPYFNKTGAEHSLLFENLRLKYYPELEKILHRCKKVVRYFMLTPRDILELDLLIPIYLEQDGAYYYINKIDSWRKGEPVKVELVALG